jgi:hypothetical protein
MKTLRIAIIFFLLCTSAYANTRSFRIVDVGGGEYSIRLRGDGWVYPVYLYIPGEEVPEIYGTRSCRVVLKLDLNYLRDYVLVDRAGNQLYLSRFPPRLSTDIRI